MIKNATNPCKKNPAYLAGTICDKTTVPEVSARNRTAAPIRNRSILCCHDPRTSNRTSLRSNTQPMINPKEAPAFDRQPYLSIGRKMITQPIPAITISLQEFSALSTHDNNRSVTISITIPIPNATNTSCGVCTPR